MISTATHAGPRHAPTEAAPTEAAAMERFLEFCEAWGQRYPAIVRLWENA